MLYFMLSADSVVLGSFSGVTMDVILVSSSGVTVGVIVVLVADPKVLGFCEAQYDYSPMETNQIAFRVGEQIAILSKSRGNRGWWKGRLNGKVCLSCPSV